MLRKEGLGQGRRGEPVSEAFELEALSVVMLGKGSVVLRYRSTRWQQEGLVGGETIWGSEKSWDPDLVV